MGIADSISQASRRSARLATNHFRGTKNTVFDGGGNANLSILGLTSQSNSSMAYHQDQYRHYSGRVYSIIRAIANRVVSQPIHVAKRIGSARQKQLRANGEKCGLTFEQKHYLPGPFKGISDDLKILTTHPIYDAFRDPNSIMVRYILMYNTVASINITGKAFWWMRWNKKKGKPEIWPLPSHWMEPVHTDKELFAKWRIWPGGVSQSFEVDNSEICYFYYPDPSDPLGAMSPLQALGRTVMADESVEESQRRSFLNSINPKMALIVGGNPELPGIQSNASPVLTREQRRTLRTLVRQEYRGVVNQDDFMILDGFIKDVKPLFTTPKELDFLNSGQATKARLDQGFGMNPIVMGEIEGANRASASVADEHVIRMVVNPLIELMSEVMTCYMPKFFSGRDDEIVYLEKAHSQDIDYELEVEKTMMATASMSRNEQRERHGMKRIANGDNVLIIRDSGTTVEVPVGDEADGDEGTLTIHSQENPDDRSDDDDDKKNASMASKMDAPATMKYWTKSENKMMPRLKAALKPVFKALSDEAVRVIETEWQRNPVPKMLSMHAVDVPKWELALRTAALPVLTEIALESASMEYLMHHDEIAVRRMVLRKKGWLPKSLLENVKHAVKKHVKHGLWGKIVQTVRSSVASALLAAQSDGRDPVAAARLVLVSPQKVLRRIERIVDTEVPAAVGTGRDETAKILHRSGALKFKSWWAHDDEVTRGSHVEANGQKVGIGEDYILSGPNGQERCQYPHDPVLSPANRCRCRCKNVYSKS